MMRPVLLRSLLPLGALALCHCMNEPTRAAGEAVEPRPAFSAREQDYHNFNTSQFTHMLGDFDGNGKKDIFYIGRYGDAHVQLAISSSAPPYTRYEFRFPAGSFGNFASGNYLLGDMSGDKQCDILFVNNDGSVYLRKAFQGIFGNAEKVVDANKDNWTWGKFLLGDFNGDGKADLYFIGMWGRTVVRLSDGSRFGEPITLIGEDLYGSWYTGKYFLGDIDGDTRDDLLFISTGGKVDVRWSNGSDYNSGQNLLLAGTFGNLTGGQYALADYTGDKKVDLLFIGLQGDVHAQISHGRDPMTYYRQLKAGAFGTIYSGQYYVGDFDGNGKSDLIFVGNLGDAHIRLSDGSGLGTYRKLWNAGDFGTPDNGIYL